MTPGSYHKFFENYRLWFMRIPRTHLLKKWVLFSQLPCQTCCSAYDVGGYKDKILWALRNFYRILHSYEWLKKCIKMGTDRHQLKFRKTVSQDLLQVQYVLGLYIEDLLLETKLHFMKINFKHSLRIYFLFYSRISLF